MSENEFWDQDMTTVHESRNWFKRLSPKRKVMFCLLAVFVIAWCFFIGFLKQLSQIQMNGLSPLVMIWAIMSWKM